MAQDIEATGGTVTNYSNGSIEYTVHTFSADGTFSVLGGSGKVDALLVGGGGAGGHAGGGGGQVVTITGFDVDATTGVYAITVGEGGAVLTAWGSDLPDNGESSTAFGFTALGGGYGAVQYAGLNDGGDGGCGGGSAYAGGAYGTAGSAINGAYGEDGGTLTINGGSYCSAGGGGAGEAGSDSTGTSPNIIGGIGGDGIPSDISGTEIYYGGGGGGTGSIVVAASLGGAGGAGGGGDGRGYSLSTYPPIAGTDGLGGGGGGGKRGGTAVEVGQPGGDGVVIIRYISNDPVIGFYSEPLGIDFAGWAAPDDIVVGGYLREPFDFEFSGYSEPVPTGYLSLTDLLEFSGLAGSGLPSNNSDFSSSLVWRGIYTDGTNLIIPRFGLNNISSADTDPTTGDYRKIYYAFLTVLKNYLDTLPWDLQARTVSVVRSDSYAFNHPRLGQVLRRLYVSKVHVSATNGDLTEEP